MSSVGSKDEIIAAFNEAAALVVCGDIDVVLVDSEKIHRQKHALTLAKCGITDLDVGLAHQTPQIYKIPKQSGTRVVQHRPLRGTSDTDVYRWAVYNRPALKSRVGSRMARSGNALLRTDGKKWRP